MATQSRIGWRPYVTQVVNAIDADAQAFIAVAGITNLTQAAAISTLVNDLKTYGLWTKMKALYPMVGGSAASHKFNLKDPRDLDAAYRLIFAGGWTHTSTGADPNGTTGYADTFVANNLMAQNSVSIGVYLGEDNTGAATTSCAIGAYSSGFGTAIYPGTNAAAGNLILNGVNNTTSVNSGQSRGFYLVSKTPTEAFTNIRGIQTNRTINPTTYKTTSFKLAKAGEYAGDYNSQQQRFTYISDGLSSTEAANLYTVVQKFQTTLGRQIGAPIVSDTDAQAFLNAAGITDLGQANAVNTLVIDLKAAGVWTKMKALYPFVGGTATAHKFNLKDPRDLDAAYRLTFTGGWTHTAGGALSNGTTGYANTFYGAGENITNGNGYLGYYTNSTTDASVLRVSNMASIETSIYQGSGVIGYQVWPYSNTTYTTSLPGLNMGGRFTSGSNSGTKLYKNGTLVVTQYPTFGNIGTNKYFYLAARNTNNTGADGFGVMNFQFTFMSDTLTDSEASVFYTAVQKYQTSLGRQSGTPVLAEGQTAGLLETYSGAAAAYSLRKLRNGYYGNAIRVRRSSDNSEQDIAFKADGTLDTVSLLAFVGSGDGFVTTWYDQSGNGLHFAQSTAANQPSIVINSVVVLTYGEPSVRFNSVNKNYLEIPSSTSSFNFLHNGTDSTVISVGRYNFVTDPGTDSTLISNGGGGSGTVGTWVGFSDISPYNNAFGAYISRGVTGIGNNATHTAVSMVNDTALPYTKQNLHFVNINTGAAAIDRIKVQYDNNTIAKSNIRSNTPSTANATNNMMMGMYIQSGVKYQSLEGDVQELIIYNSNQDTNRTGIKTNINSYYSIY